MYTFFFIQMTELPIALSIPTSGYSVTNKYIYSPGTVKIQPKLMNAQCTVLWSDLL